MPLSLPELKKERKFPCTSFRKKRTLNSKRESTRPIPTYNCTLQDGKLDSAGQITREGSSASWRMSDSVTTAMSFGIPEPHSARYRR